MVRFEMVVLASVAGCAAQKTESPVPPGGHAQGFEVGDEPLDFALPGADGEWVQLSDFAGQRILVVGTSGW